jgi:hypothetical protein
MTATADSMRAYYAQRALSHERVYDKPERQADLRAMKAWLPGHFEGRHGLEIACGTGYRTPFAAAMLGTRARSPQWTTFQHYWALSYTLH